MLRKLLLLPFILISFALNAQLFENAELESLFDYVNVPGEINGNKNYFFHSSGNVYFLEKQGVENKHTVYTYNLDTKEKTQVGPIYLAPHEYSFVGIRVSDENHIFLYSEENIHRLDSSTNTWITADDSSSSFTEFNIAKNTLSESVNTLITENCESLSTIGLCDEQEIRENLKQLYQHDNLNKDQFVYFTTNGLETSEGILAHIQNENEISLFAGSYFPDTADFIVFDHQIYFLGFYSTFNPISDGALWEQERFTLYKLKNGKIPADILSVPIINGNDSKQYYTIANNKMHANEGFEITIYNPLGKKTQTPLLESNKVYLLKIKVKQTSELLVQKLILQ